MTTPAKEQLLALPGGRTLAYCTAGVPSSTEVIIFFHGAFSVGFVSTPLSPLLVERGVQYVAPTLPGWGKTSPVPPGVPFHHQLYEDITALITHLHPNTNALKLYISGGSFGTVPAQILYGAPYDKFPLGRRVRGMLLLGPFSPFYVHKGYARCLSWGNYFVVGPPSRVFPSLHKLFLRLASGALTRKMDTPEKAEAFLRDFVFKNMRPKERELYEEWKARKGIKDGEELKEMADAMHRSCQESVEGLITIPAITQSNWGGYSPAELDEEHSKPVLLFLTHEDPEMKQMGEWLAGKLKNARIRYGEGGHVGALFVMDDIWADFMSMFPV